MSANKLTLAEYRYKYRVSLGTLPDGWKVEVLAVRTTTENYQELLSSPELYRAFDDLYGNRWRALHDSSTGSDSLIVVTYYE